MASSSVVVSILLLCSGLLTSKGSEDKEFWFKKAKVELEVAFHQKWNLREAKNVVLFIGDGMGSNTITAARIYKGLENSSLVFENFPNIGLIKTYSVDKQVPDSASTATALFTGVKNNFETVGVDESVKLNDCKTSLLERHRLSSILAWAQKEGKSTGFVTTTRVTHATPSALYAHSANRKWECDSKMPKSAKLCKDIARQLVEDEPGRNLNVIMGGGRQCMMMEPTISEEDPIDNWSCRREDGKDLVRMWVEEKQLRGHRYKYLNTTNDLTDLDAEQTDYVMGLFSNGHMKMDYKRDKSPKGMPSLSHMTESALKVLLKNDNGFILVVEGGLIDFAHHRGMARAALDETVGFEAAVRTTVDLLRAKHVLDSSLVIVTSDHAHSLAINGNPPRGNNILGLTKNPGADGVPFTTLMYATGSNDNYHYESDGSYVRRRNPTQDDTTSFNYFQQAGVLAEEALHDGGDVAIYAMGPQAHLFHKVHEQNYVAHVIAYATKIGHYGTTSGSSLQCEFSVPLVLFLYLLVLLGK